jgi:hypothetical protein
VFGGAGKTNRCLNFHQDSRLRVNDGFWGVPPLNFFQAGFSPKARLNTQ